MLISNLFAQLGFQPRTCFYNKLEHYPFQPHTEQSNREKQSDKEIVVPIVFHVVHKPGDRWITDKTIFEQVEILNQCFSSENSKIDEIPLEFQHLLPKHSISFCLADVNNLPIRSPIIRKETIIDDIGNSSSLYYDSLGGSNIIQPESTLNVYVADTGPNLLGYGRFPGHRNKNEDGVVVTPNVFGYNSTNNNSLGKILVHEIGHYFGLLHPWDNNCEENDFISDTPPQADPYYGCPNHPSASCGSPDLFMNFMDYVNDECMFMFTDGQMNHMHQMVRQLRSNLILNSPCKSISRPNKNVKFKAYTSAINGSINIVFEKNVNSVVNIAVFDVSGRSLYANSLYIHNQIEIDIPKSAGILFITANDEVVPIANLN